MSASAASSRAAVSQGRLRRQERRAALATILVPTVGAVCAAGWVLVHGAPHLASWVALLVMFLLAAFGVTVGYHRYFAHRAFRAHPAVEVVLAGCAAMAAQGPLFHWVAIHRRHHRTADQPNDPHSPRVVPGGTRLGGLWHAQLGWMLRHEPEDWQTHIPELIASRRYFGMHLTYLPWLAAGLVLPAVGVGWAQGSVEGLVEGALFGGLLRIFIGHHVTWSVNALCHVFGARAFATPDTSTNVWVLALPTLGEAWHNNHHAFPGSARHGLEPHQVDLGWALLKLLSALGLVWELRTPTPQQIARRTAAGAAITDEIERP